MLRRSLLSFKSRDGVVIPDYLGPRDDPWLRALLDEYQRFEGRRFRELARRLAEPLSPDGPRRGKARAIAVLDRLCRPRRPPVARSRAIREALFAAAAERRADPAELIKIDVAAELGIEVADLERSLFADLPSERLVSPRRPPLTPAELALETNLALARALVARAHSVVIEIAGNARAVVRQARLRGLIAEVKRPATEAIDTIIEISGPLALFRKTIVYGRSLASLVPELAGCDRFRLVARCLIDEQLVPVEIRSGDPIFPSVEPRRFDSKLAERFLRDFSRVARDWDVVREPEPIEAGGRLIAADLALEHRRDRSRRWLLEIVGFWTREYLARKLEAFRAAGVTNLILCVDAERSCDGLEPAGGARLVRYRRRIDPADILAIIETGVAR